ncbi:GyrI-like domain-containing protein [Clostridiaceae bacterium M8S5]|nr:GyrI-like domain-containing protein [Clostridiaceae bacterium M8S5]
MNCQIEIKNIESIRVAYTKYKGISTKVNNVFPNVFKAIKGKANGAPFCCFYKMNKETKIGDMELCVPTDQKPIREGVFVKDIPSIKAVCITHVGSYETLYTSYEKIEKYAKENNLNIGFPFREVYIKGPGMILKGNPNKYITEIQFPIIEVE